MDDYVSKPIERAEMYRAIERFPSLQLADLDSRSGAAVDDSVGVPTLSNQSNTKTPQPFPTPAERPAVDWAVAKHRLGSDEHDLREFAEIFTRDAPKLSAEIHNAMEARDATLLRRAAHTLKGSATYFGAEPLVEAAEALETSGRESSLNNLGDVLKTLDYELGRVLRALEIAPPISNSSVDL
jgi:HPt (histidine-containing phosphotransfer) domain-containing protein